MNDRDSFRIIPQEVAGAIIGALAAAVLIFGVFVDVARAIVRVM